MQTCLHEFSPRSEPSYCQTDSEGRTIGPNIFTDFVCLKCGLMTDELGRRDVGGQRRRNQHNPAFYLHELLKQHNMKNAPVPPTHMALIRQAFRTRYPQKPTELTKRDIQAILRSIEPQNPVVNHPRRRRKVHFSREYGEKWTSIRYELISRRPRGLSFELRKFISTKFHAIAQELKKIRTKAKSTLPLNYQIQQIAAAFDLEEHFEDEYGNGIAFYFPAPSTSFHHQVAWKKAAEKLGWKTFDFTVLDTM